MGIRQAVHRFFAEIGLFCFKPEKNRISAFKNGRNQNRQPIRKNNLFHFFQLSDFFYILSPSAPLPRLLHRSRDSQKFEKYTTVLTTARKISKNRFFSDPAGCRAEGRKPGVCPAKIGKWTAYGQINRRVFAVTFCCNKLKVTEIANFIY